MGVQNRQRRRQKQAKRDREHRRHRSEGRAESGDFWDDGPGMLPVELMIAAAAEAVHHEREDAPELIGLLADGPPVHDGRRLVVHHLVGALDDEIAELRAKQWRPSEVRHAARRRLGTRGATIAAAAVYGEWLRRAKRGPGVEWAEEAATFAGEEWGLDPDLPSWPEDLAAAVGVLGLLGHLPRLPGTGPTTSSSRRRPGANRDERILEKVRGLLAKAESTSYPDEAASLTAKAQELLTRHSLDAAALGAVDRSAGQPTASVRRLWIDDPYVGAKGHLLHVVAVANRSRCVLSDELGLATVAGHGDDLDTVEILFTSLLVQATSQMTAAGSRTDGQGRSRTRSFRQSFLVAFATRIGQRLREAGRAGESAAAEQHGSALLPVLASREAAADEAIEAIFPELVKRRMAASDREGWMRGTVAADLAMLSIQPELPGFAVDAASR